MKRKKMKDKLFAIIDLKYHIQIAQDKDRKRLEKIYKMFKNKERYVIRRI